MLCFGRSTCVQGVNREMRVMFGLGAQCGCAGLSHFLSGLSEWSGHAALASFCAPWKDKAQSKYTPSRLGQ